jgi:transcriptional regulator with XRE-family HTH domain
LNHAEDEPMPRGRPPNLERRRQLAALLAEGLSQSEVAERLGVTEQAVSIFLRGRRRHPADFRVRCREYGQHLNPAAARTENDRTTFCPACREQRPEVSFAEHLTCCRLAAGLSQEALAARAGMPRNHLSKLERDEADPSWSNAVRRFRAPGVRLVFGKGQPMK